MNDVDTTPPRKAAGKQRRSQSERRQETADRILRATIEILFENGYAGTTTAQIDERSGLSVGARVYHFKTKEDLVVAALASVYDRAAELGQARARAIPADQPPIRAFVEDCKSIYFDWPFLTALEVMVTARTNPALMNRARPILARFHGTLERVWVDVLAGSGVAPETAARQLRLTLNLIRGMAVNRIWNDNEQERDRLLDDWCRNIGGLPQGGREQTD